jgi:hypothetical protein
MRKSTRQEIVKRGRLKWRKLSWGGPAWGPSRRKLSEPALLSHVTQRGRGIGKKGELRKRGRSKDMKKFFFTLVCM